MALEIWSKFERIKVCKTLDKLKELFSRNSDNFLVFFIVFEWIRILESAVDEKKNDPKLHRDKFSMNVNVFVDVF